MTSFPAFIRAEYDGSGRGFRDFESAFQDTVGRTKRDFEKAFTEAGAIAGKAIQRGLKGGALDLGLPDMRQALAQQRAYAASLDVTAKAAASLAAASGDTTRATQDYVQGLRAAAIQAQEQADATDRNVLSYTRLQAEITRTAGANERLKQTYRDLYAEQARAENAAFAAQRSINSAVAPGLGSRATNNGATFAALERQAQRQDQLSQATDNYKRKVAELTQQLFPLEAQTARVAQQITLLETAYRRGDISAEQFAQGQARLNASLTQLGGNARGARQAMVQTGQQIQDLGISLISGQRASTVFAQQLPQLAFALTSLEGSSNKTAGAIGRFAGILSGPLGSVALVAASFGIGVLIDRLLGAENAANKTASATDLLTDRINLGKNSYESLIAVVNEYNQAQTKTESLTYSAIIAAEKMAEANLKAAKATLSLYEAEVLRGPTGPNGQGQFAASIVASRLEARVKELERDLLDSNVAASNERVRRRNDPAYDTEVRFNQELLRLEEARRDGLFDSVEYERLRLDLLKKQDAALKKIRDAERDANRKPPTRRESVADPALPAVTGSEIARLLGTTITSGKRTAAENRAAGGAANSLHLTGLAIDIPLTVNGRPLTKEGIRAALEPAGIQIRELLGPSDKGHSDHFHIGFGRRRLRPDQTARNNERELEKQNREAERITREYAQRARQITDQTVRAINEALNQRAEFLGRNLDSSREVELQRLVLAGREDEADLLARKYDLMREIGAESEAQIPAALRLLGLTQQQFDARLQDLATLQAMNREAERMDRAGLSVRAQIGELDRAYDSIVNAVASLPDDARGAVKGLFSDIRNQANEVIARALTDNLFGDLFKQLEDEIRGGDKLREANERLASSSDDTRNSIIELGRAATNAASQIASRTANDNFLPSGRTGASDVGGAAANLAVRAASRVANDVLGEGSPIGKTLKQFASTALKGGFAGQTASGLVFGNKGSATGSFLGGAIGQKLGEELGKTIGGKLGEFAGPIGGALGGIAGSLIFSAFKKPKTGSATIGGSGSSLSVSSFSGNNAKFKAAAGDSADSAISTIERLAAELGASVDASRGAVSIGIRDGKFRVDSSGRGITKTKKGAIDFGEDAEAAVRAATLDLIKDGVLTGLRASTNRILQQGKDLDAAVQKALDFESVFSRLKAIKDPVGAALDTLDKEFVKLQKIFKDAGASTEEYAQLEELYGIERAKAVKEAGERVTASLKDLFDELTVGNDARSLRTRLGLAQAQYDPLAARVAAGDTTAYDDFAEAARQLLDLERQLSGSTSAYFTTLDEVTALTKARIDAETNIASISANRDSPFDSQGNATGAANDNAAVVNAIEEQTQLQTQQLLQGIQRIMTETVRSGLSSDFRFAAFL